MKHVEEMVKRWPHLGDLRHENWGGIPFYMREGIVDYLMDGQPPGDFLKAVIDNDLFEAVGRADSTNMHHLNDYASFFWSHAPHGSYGYPGAAVARVKEFEEKRKEFKNDHHDT